MAWAGQVPGGVVWRSREQDGRLGPWGVAWAGHGGRGQTIRAWVGSGWPVRGVAQSQDGGVAWAGLWIWQGVARRSLAWFSKSREQFGMAGEARSHATHSCHKLRPEPLPEDASASGGELATLLCLGSRACSLPVIRGCKLRIPHPAGIGQWAGQHEPCQMQGLFP